MQKFPMLIDQQVALLRVNRTTGIVLDDQFKPDISLEQKRFTVFENIDEALRWIESNKIGKDYIEFVIYDKSENIIVHINE